MKAGELRERVAGGVAWSVAEKGASMLLQMVVSIVVARLLSPDDYGLMAILTVFTSVAVMVVDSGFSQSLIRGGEPSPQDFKAVFLFNIIMSLLSYGVLMAITPAVARYYDAPALLQIAPVLYLLLPLNALGVTQNAYLSRQFRFDVISKIVFCSSAVSGVTSVVMALVGCGVWSLVAQRVVQMGVKSLLLWIYGAWRPTQGWSVRPIRDMAPFSLRILFTDIINTLYNNLPSLFVGKLYSVTTLGFFNQAQKLKDLPLLSATQSVQNVTLPALSRIEGSEEKFSDSLRRLLMVVGFVMMPAMVGLIAVAEPMFAVLLGDKWMPTVPYFEIICLTGLFTPLAAIVLNVLKVRCKDGRAIVWCEIAKKTFMTVVLCLTIPTGVEALLWGLVAVSLVDLVVNLLFAMHYCCLTWGAFLRTLTPIAIVTATMYLAVVAIVSHLASVAPLWQLVAGVATGVLVYLALSIGLRLEALSELVHVVKGFIQPSNK